MQLLLLTVLVTQLLTSSLTASDFFFTIPAHTYKIQTYSEVIGVYVQCSSGIVLRVRVFEDGGNLLGSSYVDSYSINNYEQVNWQVSSPGVYYLRLEPYNFASDFIKCKVFTQNNQDQWKFIQDSYFINRTDYNPNPTIYLNQTPQNIPIKYNNTSPYIKNILAYDTSTKKTTSMPYNQYVQLPPGPKVLIVSHQLQFTASLLSEKLALHYQENSSSTTAATTTTTTQAETRQSGSGALIGGIVGGVAAACVIAAVAIYCCCCKKESNQESKIVDSPMLSAQNIHPSNPDINEDIVCSICLENNCNKTLRCNHNFHNQCISDWMKRNKQCPLCRAENKSNISLN